MNKVDKSVVKVMESFRKQLESFPNLGDKVALLYKVTIALSFNARTVCSIIETKKISMPQVPLETLEALGRFAPFVKTESKE